MNTIKTVILSLITLLFTSSINAQSLKEPVNVKLKNGMNIIVSENDRSENAYASFTLDNIAFSNKKDGVVELLNAVLNENVKNKKQLSFSDRSGKLSASPELFDQELSEMAAVLQHANIDQKTFNTAKARLLTSLKQNDYDFDQTVNEASISALSLADVNAFYHDINPENCFLTIAGAVKISSAKEAAKKSFGNWNVSKQAATLSAK